MRNISNHQRNPNVGDYNRDTPPVEVGSSLLVGWAAGSQAAVQGSQAGGWAGQAGARARGQNSLRGFDPR